MATSIVHLSVPDPYYPRIASEPMMVLCRFIRNATTTTHKNKVTCLACKKKIEDIPHTTSLVKQTKMIRVPL